jgi:hypothetical protein
MAGRWLRITVAAASAGLAPQITGRGLDGPNFSTAGGGCP